MIDEVEFLRMYRWRNHADRHDAVRKLCDDFTHHPDKNAAWKDLIQLTGSNNRYARWTATAALGTSFSRVPDKDAAWEDLHRLTSNVDSNVRQSATIALGISFSAVPDKDAAWKDLHRLTSDGDSNVRQAAAYALCSAFSKVPEIEAAWKDLVRLTGDENFDVRLSVANAISDAFCPVSDKYKIYRHLLIKHIGYNMGRLTAEAFRVTFNLLPDKESAWQNLICLTRDADSYMRQRAADSLSVAFNLFHDKESAWEDLIRLTRDDDEYVRETAASTLYSAFTQVPDKDAAWKDLIRLTKDDDEYVRQTAASTLCFAFTQVPDKDSAWKDLHRLTRDYDSDVRQTAANALCFAFSRIPDKDAAWQDLIRLTKDPDEYVRRTAANALGAAFSLVLDKNAALQDLDRLTSDKNSDVWLTTANALIGAFSQVPDKDAAWQNLHRLTSDKNSDVRRTAANALGAAFSRVLDKDSAWQDLHRLTSDKNCYVRISANYYLGRISIFKATEAEGEDDFRRELENALAYFDKSATDIQSDYKAKFCLPFYRSFYVLTCKSDSSEAEVEKYLTEAKRASEGSNSKVELLEAVENLATALKEAQRLREMNLDGVKSDLKAYMQYCNRAAELLDNTEEQAPSATKLVRKGLPIIDQRIKETITEIQEKARAICQLTRGTETPFEPLGFELNRQARELSDSDYLKSTRECLRMSRIMRSLCNLLPKSKKGLACEIIGEINEDNELGYNLSKLETALAYIQPNIEMEAYEMKIISKIDEMNSKLNNIIYNISKIKIRSADAADGLRALKWELDRIRVIESDIDSLGSKVEDLDVSQQKALQELKAQMPRLIGELETIAKDRDDKLSREILIKLDGLKRSPGETIFERATGLASIVSLLIALV